MMTVTILLRPFEAATMPTEKKLLRHLKHHGVKKWLLRGARREHAKTIRRAVLALPKRRLVRRLSRALAKG